MQTELVLEMIKYNIISSPSYPLGCTGKNLQLCQMCFYFQATALLQDRNINLNFYDDVQQIETQELY